MSLEKNILDACCGSKMFWENKNNPDVLYMDNKSFETVLCDGRKLAVKPDIVADFTRMPFGNESFYLVVFDPPHLINAGDTSWLAKKYGRLPKDWEAYIREGFCECMRVLKTNGTLIFKWSTEQLGKDRLYKAIAPYKPLFGHLTGRSGKTLWMCFMKSEKGELK